MRAKPRTSHGHFDVNGWCWSHDGAPSVSGSEVRARMHDAARFRARSTSHTVAQAPCRAVCGGPEFRLRRAGLGRMRPILNTVLVRPGSGPVHPPGSGEADRAPSNFGNEGIGFRRVSSWRPRSRHLRRHISRARPPERDQKLSRQRHDGGFVRAATLMRHPVAEPLRQRRCRLVLQPEPRPAGSSWCAAADCRTSTPLVPGLPRRSATASVQAPHRRPPAFGCRSDVRAPPTKGARRIPGRSP